MSASGCSVVSPKGCDMASHTSELLPLTGTHPVPGRAEPGTANAQPKAESPRRRQNTDIVELTLVRNYRCPKPRAREIAAAVAQIPDEDARIMAAMRMVARA